MDEVDKCLNEIMLRDEREYECCRLELLDPIETVSKCSKPISIWEAESQVLAQG